MLISYNWLKKHVDLSESITPEAVGVKLKSSTVEVEKVENLGIGLDGIVVGKILSCEKHPNADKLKLCSVDVGNEKLQIVCGGSNVVEGMFVAVAKIGAKVRWHGEGEPVVMEPAKIRGVESFGMICASTEIGLGEMFPLKEEKEILDLSQLKNISAGQPLAQALGLNDAVLEIDNKTLSHRPDLWGHYGIAREVAVLFNKDLRPYKTNKIKAGKEMKLEVEVGNSSLCPRYMAVAMSGIKVGESPEWLKQNLLAVGLRPINNIVDITNYIMLDLGQPMHAFDAGQIKGKIIVRSAKDKEKFISLDKKENILNNNDLIIADEEKPIALAGVMGGLFSGIENTTSTIIFESANFDAASVRKTSGRLGLRTDSAVRFEKSLDPNLCEIALQKAVELLTQVCPGAKVASNIVDKNNFTLAVGPIEMPINIFRNKLGVVISDKEIINILTRLGFEVKFKKEILTIKIPTWRATKDISIAEDVVEEVARIYGFDNIPSALPVFTIDPPEENILRTLERKAHNLFSKELGYTEVYNYSFVSGAQVEKMGDDISKYLELDNPLSKERPYLRRNLLPNLLDNIKSNIENYSEVKIFEIGKVYSSNETGVRVQANSDELLPKQDSWLTVVYANKKDQVPFWQARRGAEVLFSELNVKWENAPIDKVMPWEHPTRLTIIRVGSKEVGIICEIHPAVGEKYGLESRVGVLQVNLDALNSVLKKTESQRVYHSVLIYPEVVRDIAFLVKKEVKHGEITTELGKIDPLLKKIELFDVYEGKGVGEGKKSMAYRFKYSHPDRTLTTEEVDKVQEKAIKTLEKQFGAEVRK